MPLDAERTWTPETLVSCRDLLDELGTTMTLTPIGRDDPSAPARCGSSTIPTVRRSPYRLG